MVSHCNHQAASSALPLSYSSPLLHLFLRKADPLHRVESLNERVRDVNKKVEEGRRIDDDKLEDIKDDLKAFKEDLKTLREGPDGEKFCLFAVLDAGSGQITT